MIKLNASEATCTLLKKTNRINFHYFTGDFPAMWNSISSDNQELNHNSNSENALGINGE